MADRREETVRKAPVHGPIGLPLASMVPHPVHQAQHRRGTRTVKKTALPMRMGGESLSP